jgi:WXG100 family type VII secretion target
MAERITVSTEEMQATLSTYSTQKGAQATAFTSMNTAVNALDSVWQGDASNTFKQQFQKFYNNIRLSEEKMQDAVDELRKTSDAFTEAENANKTTFAGLDTGTSPFA